MLSNKTAAYVRDESTLDRSRGTERKKCWNKLTFCLCNNNCAKHNGGPISLAGWVLSSIIGIRYKCWGQGDPFFWIRGLGDLFFWIRGLGDLVFWIRGLGDLVFRIRGLGDPFFWSRGLGDPFWISLWSNVTTQDGVNDIICTPFEKALVYCIATTFREFLTSVRVGSLWISAKLPGNDYSLDCSSVLYIVSSDLPVLI